MQMGSPQVWLQLALQQPLRNTSNERERWPGPCAGVESLLPGPRVPARGSWAWELWAGGCSRCPAEKGEAVLTHCPPRRHHAALRAGRRRHRLLGAPDLHPLRVH